FFQAEDGIRDFHVTGVQTCALPIYGARAPLLDLPGEGFEVGGAGPRTKEVFCRLDLVDVDELGVGRAEAGRGDERHRQVVHEARSEERRVGKEGRSSRLQWNEKRKR